MIKKNIIKNIAMLFILALQYIQYEHIKEGEA